MADDVSTDPANPQSTTSDQMLNQIVQQLLSKQGGTTGLQDIGTVLGGAAAGRAAGTNAQNSTALQGGGLANNLYQSALDRAKLQAALPNFRAQQAVTGDQIANMQDVVPTGPANVMSHVVNFTGGKRPSNLGPNARAAGAALSNIGASNIGQDVLPQVPAMPNLSNGGVLGNILGGGSLAASLLAAIQKLGKGGSSGGGSGGGSGPGSGGAIDLGKLFAGLKGQGGMTGTTVTGDQGPEQYGGVTPGEQFGLPQDPSQGGGMGPGMQAYYDWLKTQGAGGGEDQGNEFPSDGYGE